jgi:TetR/AcrR family transcriptional repressor of nem operon
VVEDKLFDDLIGRAYELSEDPFQAALIGLKLLAELIEDMPGAHPGCLVASAAYQDRLFNQDVREANRRAALGWRTRFKKMFELILDVYPMRDDVEIDHLSDMVGSIVEGGIVMSRAMGDPLITSQPIMLLRSYVKLLFAPKLQ